MDLKLAKQYDAFAQEFSMAHDLGEGSNRNNRIVFYRHIDFIGPGMKVLDLGCGDGLDMTYYRSLGAEVYGLDASEELVKIARNRNPESEIVVGDFTKRLPYPDHFFDAVLSKYAIQTAKDMGPIFGEVARVLKPGGTLLYLVTHPFRQFMERKDVGGDYFEQTTVNSHILNGALTVKEPTHTLNEYFDSCFMARFAIKEFDEKWDAAAEQISGGKYPGYFIVKAVRKWGKGDPVPDLPSIKLVNNPQTYSEGQKEDGLVKLQMPNYVIEALKITAYCLLAAAIVLLVPDLRMLAAQTMQLALDAASITREEALQHGQGMFTCLVLFGTMLGIGWRTFILIMTIETICGTLLLAWSMEYGWIG